MKRPHHSAATLMACLAACSPPQQAAAPSPTILTITATDYAFAAPDTIPAGLTTVRMVNQGREPHQAVLYGSPGKTFAELEAVAVPKGPEPEWWHSFLAIGPTFPGGAGAVVSGDTSVITANLAPGNYMIVCFIPSPDGKWHVQKGMFRRLVVAPAPAGRVAVAEPKSDLTVTLSDNAFNISAPVTAGRHTIRIENSGPQVHELTVERLAPGKTMADWQQWARGGMKGPPVSIPVGGFTGPDTGKVGWVTLTFTPGNYLFLCYVPDAKDGAPHLLHGMVQAVTVR